MDAANGSTNFMGDVQEIKRNRKRELAEVGLWYLPFYFQLFTIDEYVISFIYSTYAYMAKRK